MELYDRTLVSEANRLLRAYEGRCETVDVYVPANFHVKPADAGYEVFDGAMTRLGRAGSWADVQDLLPDGAHELLTPMHGVRLGSDLRQELIRDGFCAWGGLIR